MQLLEIIDKVINDCYSDKYRDALEEVSSLIEELYKGYSDNQEIVPVLRTMLSAMEKKDNILIGDCLEYGIKPLLLMGNVPEELFLEGAGIIPDIGEDIYYYASYTEEPILCMRDSEGTMVRLNSLFSPVNEVDKWLINQNLKIKTPAVCLFGIGTGLFAEAILKKLPDDSKLFLVEPNNDIIDYCIKSGERSDSDVAERRIASRLKRIINDERVCLIIEDKDETAFRYKLEQVMGYLNLRGLIVSKHNNYDKIFPEKCLKFIREINDYRIKMITNKNTISYFKEMFVDNVFKNMWMYKRINTRNEIAEIIPRDIPAIIVSAGPSLDKNIEVLHQAKGHCLIFAVDTAVRYLLKKNIVPDITITIDSEKPADYFCDEASHYIPCFFDVTANPLIVSAHKGRMLLFNNSNFYISRLFESIGKIIPMDANGGSVATAAFAVLYALRQKKIILMGQDLAFENGVTHAGGVDDEANFVQSKVEGINGEEVTTRSDWLGYLKWFEKSIETIKVNGFDIQVIDATEGGAKIHGADIMTLQEAIDGCRDVDGNLPDYDFGKELEKLDYYLNEKEYDQLLKNHLDAIEKLKEIEKQSDEAVRKCRNLLKGIEEGTVSGRFVDKEKKKIGKINEFCSRSRIYPVVNEYLITDVVDEVCQLRLAEGDIKTTEINGINLMRISFEAISEASKKIYKRAKEIEIPK